MFINAYFIFLFSNQFKSSDRQYQTSAVNSHISSEDLINLVHEIYSECMTLIALF